MDIAIIGSGISGLTAAYLLSKQHKVSVFEQSERIGGHTATVDVRHEDRDYRIDTGFIVYNDWTYPNFIHLMEELGVDSQPTTMGFSVSGNGLEYSGASLATLFAQKRNLLNPRHWRMLYDILRFNKQALNDLEHKCLDEQLTLANYLKKHGYGDAFQHNYLLPMASAIWSTGTTEIAEIPVQFFVRFFRNHGLLNVKNRPQWRVIKGGSSSYLEPLCKPFQHRIHTHSDIRSIERQSDRARIHFHNRESQDFDAVVLACHSDQALQLLQNPSEDEKRILGAIDYRKNDVVLHTDTAQLPQRRSTWSSWNYRLNERASQRAAVTYHMNILQGIRSNTDFLVTLNNSEQIDPKKILQTFSYAHPVFNPKAIRAQQQWSAINGQHIWFCGAYWHNGFHEDGVNSALQVAKAFGIDWQTPRTLNSATESAAQHDACN